MKKFFLVFAAVLINFGIPYAQSGNISSYTDGDMIIISTVPSYEGLASAQRTLDYTIRGSVDNFGNLYIRAWSQLPSVLTFVDSGGSVTVCTSDEAEKTTHIYEYDSRLAETKVLSFKNELASLGAFAKDDDGNYYFFYGETAKNVQSENMAVVKYDRNGEKINTFKLKANPRDGFSTIKILFDAGTCRLELSGSLLCVYFAHQRFDGHQASFGFVLNKDTFERIDRGHAYYYRDGTYPKGKNLLPFTGHSFNQFILPIENGFVIADHGDAYPRAFTFGKFYDEANTVRLNAFRFPGSVGANPTYAEMGGLAKTQSGYIFAGTYGRVQNEARNLFIITFDEDMTNRSSPVYLTKYTRADGHAGHPKIVSVGNGQYLLLWELFRFSTQGANTIAGGASGYISTFALIINEKGEAVSQVREFSGIRLNINDILRYSPGSGKAYWAINGSADSIIAYALDVGL